MNHTDRIFYENKEIQDAKHRKALSKAAYRGERSAEWHKTNSLTAATLNDFKKAMKKADKDWETINAIN